LVSGKRNHTGYVKNEPQAYSRLCGRTAAAIKLHHPGAKTAIWLLFVENGMMGHQYSSDAESEQTQFFLTATERCLKELSRARDFITRMQRPEVILLFIHSIIKIPVLLKTAVGKYIGKLLPTRHAN